MDKERVVCSSLHQLIYVKLNRQLFVFLMQASMKFPLETPSYSIHIHNLHTSCLLIHNENKRKYSSSVDIFTFKYIAYQSIMYNLPIDIRSCIFFFSISFPQDYFGALNDLLGRLSAASADKPLVMFLDGINHLSTEHSAHTVHTWLPKQLPDHVHIIVSTSSTSEMDILKGLKVGFCCVFTLNNTKSVL